MESLNEFSAYNSLCDFVFCLPAYAELKLNLLIQGKRENHDSDVQGLIDTSAPFKRPLGWISVATENWRGAGSIFLLGLFILNSINISTYQCLAK